MVLTASPEKKAPARLINKWGLLVLRVKTSRVIRLQAGMSRLRIYCFAVLTMLQPQAGFPHGSGMVAQGNQSYTLALSSTGSGSVPVPSH